VAGNLYRLKTTDEKRIAVDRIKTLTLALSQRERGRLVAGS